MPLWVIVTLSSLGFFAIAVPTVAVFEDKISKDVSSRDAMIFVAAALWPITWLIVAAVASRRGARGWLAVLPKRRTVPEARAREVAE